MCGRFVCLFTHQRTLESFPPLVCCLSRRGERPRASLRLSPCFRFSGRGPRRRTAGPRFLRIPSIVPAAAVPGYVPTMSSSQGAGGSGAPASYPTLVTPLRVQIAAVPAGGEWDLPRCGFGSHLPNDSRCRHLSMCLFAVCIYPSFQLFDSFARFFVGCLCLFVVES